MTIGGYGPGTTAQNENRSTGWTVDGQSQATDANGLSESYVTFSDLQTDGSGNLVVTTYDVAGNGTSVLSALQLTATSDATYSNWASEYGLTGSDALVEADVIDRDGIPNAVEAWFGTDPTLSSPGLSIATIGQTTTTFSHPQNANPPSDLTGSYQWSTNLVDWYACDGVDGPVNGSTITALPNTVGDTTTVTTTSSESLDRFFLRVVVEQN